MTNMKRDTRTAWPAGASAGSFDIIPGAAEGYSNTAHLLFVCPNGHRCSLLLGPTMHDRPTPDGLYVWQWDGNVDKPTITPSINCAVKDGKPAVGGCGWHGTITDGVMK